MSKSFNFSQLTDPLDQNKHLERLLKYQFDNELRDSLTQKLAIEKDIIRGKTSPRRYTLISLISGIAASVLLLILYTNVLPETSVKGEIFINEAVSQKILHPGITKGAIDVDQVRLNAIAAFNRQDYQESISNFEKIDDISQEDAFYKAMSSFYLEDYDQAEMELTYLLNTESIIREEVRWYLAITHIRMENKEEAKTLLSSIESTEWNYTKAQQILELFR